jgi:hypothetical protein
MSIARNIKTRFLKRKQIDSKKRAVILKRPELFSKILLVLNASDDTLVQAARSAFPAAAIQVLHLRKEKEDTSAEGYYTARSTDFNLTGILKNDKLNRLLQTEFDLLIDLSTDSVILTYLVQHIKSSLIIGKMEHPGFEMYDLFFNQSATDKEFLQQIVQQLNQLIKK